MLTIAKTWRLTITKTLPAVIEWRLAEALRHLAVISKALPAREASLRPLAKALALLAYA